jgi:hypothetical protein
MVCSVLALLLDRNTALRVCEAFISSPTPPERDPRPFVYVSAEDIFRPLIPGRYIETKREAEQGIEGMIAGNAGFRGVYIRPSACLLDLAWSRANTHQGLVYHAHYRPLTTPIAALLDLSATLHRKAPGGIPTPSSVARTLSRHGSSLESIANALVIPPIHVDQVAEAICVVLEPRNGIRGVVDTGCMRELIS